MRPSLLFSVSEFSASVFFVCLVERDQMLISWPVRLFQNCRIAFWLVTP